VLTFTVHTHSPTII